MICSSLYLLVLMSIIFRVDGLLGKITGTAYGEQVTVAAHHVGDHGNIQRSAFFFSHSLYGVFKH